MEVPGFFDAIRNTPILVRALEAGALSGFCCACLSPLVVLRRMAFIGDGISHAAFGGIGLALFLMSSAHYDDLSVQVVTVLFCLVIGFGIGLVSRRSDVSLLSEDSAIGVAFSVSMALGALFLTLRQHANPQYVPPMDTYLFGSMLNIGSRDVWIMLLLALLVLAVLVIFQKELLFYAFDAQLAEVSGLNVRLLHYLFMLILVLTVVVSSRVVGIILVSASLVLPGIAALKICTRLFPAMIVSAVIGVVSFEVGMYVSYAQDVQPGSAIILIQFAVLLLAAGWKSTVAIRKTA
jgi:zinc transport system permease protein